MGGAVTLPQDFPVRFVTSVIDNGTAPRDPADQIGLLLSESFFGPCTDAPDDPLIFSLVHGQVTIR